MVIRYKPGCHHLCTAHRNRCAADEMNSVLPPIDGYPWHGTSLTGEGVMHTHLGWYQLVGTQKMIDPRSMNKRVYDTSTTLMVITSCAYAGN